MTLLHAPLLPWLFFHVLFLAVLLGIALVAILVVLQVVILVPLLLAACIDRLGRCFGHRWRFTHAVYTFLLVSTPSFRTGHWITRGRDGHLVHERYFRVGLPWPRIAVRDVDDRQVYGCGRQVSWSRSTGVKLDYKPVDTARN